VDDCGYLCIIPSRLSQYGPIIQAATGRVCVEATGWVINLRGCSVVAAGNTAVLGLAIAVRVGRFSKMASCAELVTGKCRTLRLGHDPTRETSSSPPIRY
jgi:hypothetical protein